jgi:hypothetical protein
VRKQLGDSEKRNSQLEKRNRELESQQRRPNPQQSTSIQHDGPSFEQPLESRQSRHNPQQPTSVHHYGPSFEQQQAWAQEEAYQNHQLVMANSRQALKSVQQSSQVLMHLLSPLCLSLRSLDLIFITHRTTPPVLIGPTPALTSGLAPALGPVQASAAALGRVQASAAALGRAQASAAVEFNSFIVLGDSYLL